MIDMMYTHTQTQIQGSPHIKISQTDQPSLFFLSFHIVLLGLLPLSPLVALLPPLAFNSNQFCFSV